MEMHPVQGSVQGSLPIRERGAAMHPMLNRPPEEGRSGVPEPKEPLAPLDHALMERLIRGIERW